MKLDLEALEAEINRATNEQDKQDLRAALVDLKAISARHELSDSRRAKLGPKKFLLGLLCLLPITIFLWWQVSKILNIKNPGVQSPLFAYEKELFFQCMLGLFFLYAIYAGMKILYLLCVSKLEQSVYKQ